MRKSHFYLTFTPKNPTMLKGIHPLLSPELLKVLAEMGHDDAIAVVDANFTAASLGAGKPLIRLPGVGVLEAVSAVLSLLPLAADVPHPVGYMQVEGQALNFRSTIQRQAIALAEQAFERPQQSAEAIERFAFYERVRRAYAIVVTGELQPFANFILRKGVVGEALRA
jgi:L-fucose mutarotase